jgi:hypothetical protein
LIDERELRRAVAPVPAVEPAALSQQQDRNLAATQYLRGRAADDQLADS